MNDRKIIILDDPESLFVHIAEEIVHFAGEAICTHGEFIVCLTGGSTPASTYELLGTRFRLSVDWKEVQFYWGDERCVAPNDTASNYGMANRTLLSKLPVKPNQIHRMRGELPPQEGAGEYQEELRRGLGLEEDEFPRFDLVLLGVGDNCHIASLFPRHPAIHETQKTVVAVEVPATQPHRITITPPVINNAQRVMFLVSGRQKASAVQKILEGPRDYDQIPAQIVDPHDGEVIWFLDSAAASLLTKK